jgi:hypothetical protein
MVQEPSRRIRFGRSLIRFGALLLVVAFASACVTIRQKPSRYLIYASAGLKAADRAGAERRAPDSYRKAENAFWEARTFYQQKQYELAASKAVEARRYAEQAELEAEMRAAFGSSGDSF